MEVSNGSVARPMTSDRVERRHIALEAAERSISRKPIPLPVEGRSASAMGPGRLFARRERREDGQGILTEPFAMNFDWLTQSR